MVKKIKLKDASTDDLWLKFRQVIDANVGKKLSALKKGEIEDVARVLMMRANKLEEDNDTIKDDTT